MRAARRLGRAGAWLARCHSHTVCWSKQVKRPPDTRGRGTSSARRSSKGLSPGASRGDLRRLPARRPLEVRCGRAWTAEHGLFVKEKKKVQGLKDAFENHSMIANSPENTVNTGVRSIYSSPEEKSSWQEQQGS